MGGIEEAQKAEEKGKKENRNVEQGRQKKNRFLKNE